MVPVIDNNLNLYSNIRGFTKFNYVVRHTLILVRFPVSATRDDLGDHFVQATNDQRRQSIHPDFETHEQSSKVRNRVPVASQKGPWSNKNFSKNLTFIGSAKNALLMNDNTQDRSHLLEISAPHSILYKITKNADAKIARLTISQAEKSLILLKSILALDGSVL